MERFNLEVGSSGMKVECPSCSETAEFEKDVFCSHREKPLKRCTDVCVEAFIFGFSAVVLTAGGLWGGPPHFSSSFGKTRIALSAPAAVSLPELSEQQADEHPMAPVISIVASVV
ncbi:hypothetical protein [Salicola sp. Rm-C-2C1-2]|uniref:hypothetical protein n=1 Tax=Salicola sp. Rm-C-2C1-2 TaxID=3141321 RepID=UPI0032E49B83